MAVSVGLKGRYRIEALIGQGGFWWVGGLVSWFVFP